MVVLVVKRIDVSISKLERDPPVPIYPNGPTSFLLPLQGMEIEPGHVHVPDRPGGIQGSQEHPEALGVHGLNPRRRASLMEAPQPLVPKRLDHRQSVPRCAMRNNRRLTPQLSGATPAFQHAGARKFGSAGTQPAGGARGRVTRESAPVSSWNRRPVGGKSVRRNHADMSTFPVAAARWMRDFSPAVTAKSRSSRARTAAAPLARRASSWETPCSRSC